MFNSNIWSKSAQLGDIRLRNQSDLNLNISRSFKLKGASRLESDLDFNLSRSFNAKGCIETGFGYF